MKWLLPPEQKQIRAVALITHGLNLQPDRMQPLAEVLREWGAHVYLAALSGHRGDLPEFQKVTRQRWLKDLEEAYFEAQARATQAEVPLIFLGYSLGAGLGQDLVNENSKVSFEKQILIAPSLGLRPQTHLVRAFSALGDDFVVPSLSYGRYHAHSGVPVCAYRALFESVRKTKASGLKRSNIPTLVLVDPKDELISIRSLENLVQQHNLNQWKIERLDSPRPRRLVYHHLSVDSACLGSNGWSKMTQTILDFLSTNGTSCQRISY